MFGGARVISEANWAEYEARGVSNVVEAVPEDDDTTLRDTLARTGKEYGAANLLLGDAFDTEAGRPLQHKPGTGLYVTAEGVADYHRRHPPPVLRLPDDRMFELRKGKLVEVRRDDAQSGVGAEPLKKPPTP